ncbi:DUF1800 domain-containing protein [uncultured Jannaschia sp.]|uniref:DUF1800 domain-containing protein n=1 Tax=uncultured Jannaschia sp. TaxID=293347 RepID=UPI0026116DC9|nr:DUF1800 domain-containing protein [uncultured Jannaschia sp.]
MISTLAAIRFGTGRAPDIAAPRDAGDLLLRLSGPDRMAKAWPQPSWEMRAAAALDWIRLRRARRDGGADAFRAAQRAMVVAYHEDLARALARAALTEDGFRERLAWFWADHFAVAGGRGLLRRSVPSYHEAAIRPHLAGSFADLLTAAVTHPAMVIYLDNWGSTGPNSPRGRRSGGNINENLAREVLELHTLGAGAAYRQTDVRQLAELLTGLSITREGDPQFRHNQAEPGAETVLGRSYGGAEPDRGDIDRVLADLAVHPDTARHLSTKLARHFVADTPDPDLVARMTATWTRTGGDLMAVYATMLDHDAAWQPTLAKVRRPMELLAAGLRALGRGRAIMEADVPALRNLANQPLERMGQTWLRPPGPQGWPEAAPEWITPQLLAARLGWAIALPEALGDLPDPRDFVETALGPLADGRLRFAAAAAEERAAGISLVLASPAFNRR